MDNTSIRTNPKHWVRMFDVGDPQRHKNGFTVYKVTSKVEFGYAYIIGD